MENRYYDCVDSWELSVAQTLIGTQFRFPSRDRSMSLRIVDWEGTIWKWPSLDRGMNQALFFPFFCPYKTLEGQPQEATKYFLENLKNCHEEIMRELFHTLERLKKLEKHEARLLAYMCQGDQ